MRPSDPLPPGPLAEWLDALLAKEHISGTELARRIRVSPTTISNIRWGKPASLETIRKLADYAGVEQHVLEALVPGDGQHDPDLVDVWEHETVTIGAGQPFGVPQYWGQYRVSSPSERTHRFEVYRVTGDCLAPRIENGDKVVVDATRRDDWRTGELVAVRHDGDLLVKRVEADDEGLIFVADDGTRLRPDNDTRIVGVVVEIRKRP